MVIWKKKEKKRKEEELLINVKFSLVPSPWVRYDWGKNAGVGTVGYHLEVFEGR